MRLIQIFIDTKICFSSSTFCTFKSLVIGETKNDILGFVAVSSANERIDCSK
jgi:hypothetical protein